MSIDEVDQLIDNFMFKHLISDEGIVIHVGPGNVIMENGEYYDYDYVNTQPVGSRSLHEQNEIIILNEMMYIMNRIKTYIYAHNPPSTPIEPDLEIEDHNDEDDQQSIIESHYYTEEGLTVDEDGNPIQDEIVKSALNPNSSEFNPVESLVNGVNEINMNDI